ncbi:MAG: arginyltransferase [Alphaproteobacteria bacterium]
MTKPVNIPRFYVTAPSPCPYLTGREERKIFTRLSGDEPAQLHDALADMGFRRSQNIAYRPACVGCNACTSARVPVAEFDPGRNLRRIVKRNQDLRLGFGGATATIEQYHLLRRYLHARHGDGGMAAMDAFDYQMMVEDSPITTYLLELRQPDGDEEGRLMAACITDVVGDGLSMVYSFFDPGEQRRSLGSCMILRHIELAREMKLSYVYLGYWIEGSRKMHYKSRFQPLELLGPGGWLAPGCPKPEGD